MRPVEILATDAAGQAVAGARVTITPADGQPVEATSDRLGVAQLDVPDGTDVVHVRLERTDDCHVVGNGDHPYPLAGTVTARLDDLDAAPAPGRAVAGQARQAARDRLDELEEILARPGDDPTRLPDAVAAIAESLDLVVRALG